MPDGTLEAMAPVVLTTHSMIHATGRGPPTDRSERFKRPIISSGGTRATFDYFLTRWSEYAWNTKLKDRELVMHLLECCDEQLRMDLFCNRGGTLAELTQDEVLKAIEVLAVRKENMRVARKALHGMRQGRDEPVRAFGARLRGQAAVCNFSKVCGCGCDVAVNYSEETVNDILCLGLADPEIQKEIMSDLNQKWTLEETLELVEAKESGRRSMAQLSTPQTIDAVDSTYNKLKRPAQRDRTPGGMSVPTVEAWDTAVTPLREFDEPNVRHSERCAATAVKKTTWQRCAEAVQYRKSTTTQGRGERSQSAMATHCSTIRAPSPRSRRTGSTP